MSWLLLLIPWVPLTYFLHVLIHEGAHWLVFKSYGVPSTIHLLPGKNSDGSTNFGRCVPDNLADWLEFSEPRRALFWLAPVLAEMAWIILALVGSKLSPWILLEVLAASVDLLMWLLAPSEQSDANKLRRLLGDV